MSSIPEEIQRVLDAAELVHDEKTVSKACDRLSVEIEDRVAGRDAVMLTIMQGGMFVAAELYKRMRTPFQTDYLHATRYRGETTGRDLVWKAMPHLDLTGRVAVVVDDILDEGHTLAAVQEALLSQQPEELITAVLVEKQHDRRSTDVKADFVGLQVPDHYLFGCGLDYKGYLRQYPAIYAVVNDTAVPTHHV